MFCCDVWLKGAGEGKEEETGRCHGLSKMSLSPKNHPLPGCLHLSPHPYFRSILLSMKE